MVTTIFDGYGWSLGNNNNINKNRKQINSELESKLKSELESLAR